MLEEVRKPSRAKSVLAYIIFGAIIVVFIGFGVTPDKMSSDVHGVAAMVNRQQISLADLRDRVQVMERQFQSRMDQIPASQRAEMTQMLRQRALEDLIQFEVMVQDASEKGVRVADEEVRDTIVDIPAFQEEGHFKRDFYDRYLQERQWSAGQFENKIRKDLMMRKVQTLFQDALRPTSIEKTKDQALEGTKINLELIVYNDEILKANVPVSDAEIKTWLSRKENQENIQRAYSNNLGAYAEPEQIKARHILIGVDRSNPASEASAKAKVADLAEKVKTEDFGKLAKEFSDDAATKKSGGDLGYFSKGRMVPEFEAAAFALAPGQISAPVKTDFGYHLIQVQDKKPPRNKPFEEVQNELAKAEIAATKISSTNKRLEEEAAARNEVEIRRLVKQLGLKWTETGAFSLAANQIPQVSDPDRLMDGLIKHKTRKGVLPEIIKARGMNHLVIVKSFAEADQTPQPGESLAGSRKFYDAFSNWAKGAIGKADIKRNNAVLMN